MSPPTPVARQFDSNVRRVERVDERSSSSNHRLVGRYGASRGQSIGWERRVRRVTVCVVGALFVCEKIKYILNKLIIWVSNFLSLDIETRIFSTIFAFGLQPIFTKNTYPDIKIISSTNVCGGGRNGQMFLCTLILNYPHMHIVYVNDSCV